MVVAHARDILAKSIRIVGRQQRLVERLKAKGADTTEAEHLLAYFVTAHMMFENCLQKAIRSGMSASPLRAEMLSVGINVCRVPEADINRAAACHVGFRR